MSGVTLRRLTACVLLCIGLHIAAQDSISANAPAAILTDGHSDGVYDLAFSADGRFLASASLDKTVRIWDTQAGLLLRSIPGHLDKEFQSDTRRPGRNRV